MAAKLRNKPYLLVVLTLLLMFEGSGITPLYSEEAKGTGRVQLELMGGTAHLFNDDQSFADYNAMLNFGMAYGNSWHGAAIFTAQRIYEEEQAYTDAYAQTLGMFRPNLNLYSFEFLGGYRFRVFRRLEPVARLGLVYARRSYEHDFLNTEYRDNKLGFAAYAGAQYHLTERLSLSLACRLFLTGKSDIAANWTNLFNAGRRQVGVLGGIAIAL